MPEIGTMIDKVEGQEVQAAGKKVLQLSELEGWSGPLLFCTLVALVEFLEGQGFERLGDIDEWNRN